jgi:hypothetical protein
LDQIHFLHFLFPGTTLLKSTRQKLFHGSLSVSQIGGGIVLFDLPITQGGLGPAESAFKTALDPPGLLGTVQNAVKGTGEKLSLAGGTYRTKHHEMILGCRSIHFRHNDDSIFTWLIYEM